MPQRILFVEKEKGSRMLVHDRYVNLSHSWSHHKDTEILTLKKYKNDKKDEPLEANEILWYPPNNKLRSS